MNGSFRNINSGQLRYREIQLALPDQRELRKFTTRARGSVLCVAYGDPSCKLLEEVPEPLEYSDDFSYLVKKGYWFIAVPDPRTLDWEAPNYKTCFMRHDANDGEITYIGPLEVCWIDVPKRLRF